jgi:DNA topoisomerase-1
VAPHLSRDQLALYQLVWQRFVASQMQEALIDQVSASIAAGPYVFTASGSAVKFPGFMALYRAEEEDAEGNGNGDKAREQLPELTEGKRLALQRLEPRQHFTQPPPRFSEASLVKELEENGIGRPSTYAAILSTIRDKGYVDWVKGYFRPSELGFIVNDLLVASFPDVFDVEFTARMEESLDRVETEKANSVDLLTRFYTPFRKDLDRAAEGMVSIKGVGVATDLKCPECGHTLHVKIGKNGHFLACSGYPDCKYSRDYTRDEKGNIQAVEPPADQPTDKHCEKCGRPMVLKRGPYGDFFACSGYPECRNTQSRSLNGNGKAIGVGCPKDGCTGELLEKTSKRGKTFYGCNRYPDCAFASWDRPVARDCPACGARILVERVTKRQGTLHACLNPDCGFKEQVE